jgi:hypothetical protein
MTTQTDLKDAERLLAVALRENSEQEIAKLESAIEELRGVIAAQTQAAHDQAQLEVKAKEHAQRREWLRSVAVEQHELHAAHRELLATYCEQLRFEARVKDAYAEYVKVKQSRPASAEAVHGLEQRLRSAGVFIEAQELETVRDAAHRTNSSAAELRALADTYEIRAAQVVEPPFELIELGLRIKELVHQAAETERAIDLTPAPVAGMQAYNVRLAEYSNRMQSLRAQLSDTHGELRSARQRFTQMSAELVPRVEKVSAPGPRIAEPYDHIFDGVSHS